GGGRGGGGVGARADGRGGGAAGGAAGGGGGGRGRGEGLARRQSIPKTFLENILTELRRAGIVRTRRGAEGGYQLARPASEITVAEVLRSVEGPLAAVQGVRPDQLTYEGSADSVQAVWIAWRAALRDGVEHF